MKDTNAPEKHSLLDDLLAVTEYNFISDLRYFYKADYTCIINGVNRLKIHSYSVKEWTDAVCYITGVQREFHSVTQAVGFLKNQGL